MAGEVECFVVMASLCPLASLNLPARLSCEAEEEAVTTHLRLLLCQIDLFPEHPLHICPPAAGEAGDCCGTCANRQGDIVKQVIQHESYFRPVPPKLSVLPSSSSANSRVLGSLCGSGYI